MKREFELLSNSDEAPESVKKLVRLNYGFPLKSCNFRLIELPLEVTTELKNSPDAFVQIKSGDDQKRSAVLCTNTSSFQLQFRENSNSLLLVSDFNGAVIRKNADIVASLNGVIELIKIQPRLDTLREMLEECEAYNGMEEWNGKCVEWKLIETKVQASASEIFHALNELYAFEIEVSKWVILDRKLICDILSLIFDTATLKGWNCCKNIPRNELIQEMKSDCEENVLVRVLELFADENEMNTELKLKEYEIIRVVGESLLEKHCNLQLISKTQIVSESQFEKLWKDALPDEFCIKWDALNGLAVVVSTPAQRYVEYFPRHRLAVDAKMRFDAMFEKKKSWTRAEIDPYLSDLSCSVKETEALLKKYCKEIKSICGAAGPTTYQARTVLRSKS